MTTFEKKLKKRVSNRVRPMPAKSGKAVAWNIRHWVQLGVLVLTVAIGLQFSVFVYQLVQNSAISVQRPPGVEGFLPIGALMGWKLFVTTGIWDPIHPAAMVILGYAGLISLVLRKSFCSWFCPVGTLSEWTWKLGRKIFGRNVRLPLWLDYPLRSLKYFLLGFFVWVIFSMGNREVFEFLNGPYYKMSDVKMLFFFLRMSALKAAVLIFLTLVSFAVKNFWCRYLCPYGALMGLMAFIGPTRIERDTATCIDCGQCSRVCPSHLPVDAKQRIISPECTGCMDCTGICPVEDTLKLKTLGFRRKAWSILGLGIVVMALFAVSVYTARITGHWQTRIPPVEYRMLIQKIDSPEMTHP